MIVLPMAGASSRFTRAGYPVPKWRLPLGGRPLFDWCASTFRRQFATEPILVLHRGETGVDEFVRQRLTALGVARFDTAAVAPPTKGQADTVAIGLDAVDADPAEPLTIFNIDTIRLGYRPDPAGDDADGLVECFRGEGDHWSFVRPAEGPGNRAAQVTEKVRVSDLCSDGLYRFRSVEVFRTAFAAEAADPSAGELYVAPLYQRMIDAGLDVRYSVVPAEDVVLSGTPAEYEAAVLDDRLH